MAIYQLTRDGLTPIERTAFATQGIREWEDLQRFLREKIEMGSTSDDHCFGILSGFELPRLDHFKGRSETGHSRIHLVLPQ